MDLLLICHCKDLHDPIYINDELFVEGMHNIRSVKYLDTSQFISKDIPTCKPSDIQLVNWKGSKLFDAIWSIHCPVNSTSRSVVDESIWTNILIDGWRILKDKGAVVMPLAGNPTSSKAIMRKNVNYFLNNLNVTYKWKATYVDKVPFIIGTKGDYENYKSFLILTKLNVGGRRRKTIKRST